MVVREMGKRERTEASNGMRYILGDDYYKSIWMSMWPESTADWKSDWQSFPLGRRNKRPPADIVEAVWFDLRNPIQGLSVSFIWRSRGSEGMCIQH